MMSRIPLSHADDGRGSPSQDRQTSRLDQAVATWRRYLNHVIGRELSTLTRYCDQVIQWAPRREDRGLLLAEIDCKVKSLVEQGEPFPDLHDEETRRTAI